MFDLQLHSNRTVCVEIRTSGDKRQRRRRGSVWKTQHSVFPTGVVVDARLDRDRSRSLSLTAIVDAIVSFRSAGLFS